MALLPGPVEFQWDDGNIHKPEKHGLTPEQAEEAFFDDNKVVFKDWMHSSELEQRTTMLGKTKKGMLLNITFTVRDKKVRVISARPTNKKEVPLYEKAT